MMPKPILSFCYKSPDTGPKLPVAYCNFPVHDLPAHAIYLPFQKYTSDHVTPMRKKQNPLMVPCIN